MEQIAHKSTYLISIKLTDFNFIYLFYNVKEIQDPRQDLHFYNYILLNELGLPLNIPSIYPR